ncbi:MAG: hypothetical protein IAG10_29220, partial [Planctomycetaceae bacterium]|nr:hypothetical protein [Planctomycetaceae bacterium]
MLLLSIILLPLLAATLLALLGGGRTVARWVALLTAIGTLLISLGIASQVTAAREGHAMATADRPVDGPVQPKLEWRRTWMTLGEVELKSPRTVATRMDAATIAPGAGSEVELKNAQDAEPVLDEGSLAREAAEVSRSAPRRFEEKPNNLEHVPFPEVVPVRLEFYLGADGISVLMLALTGILTVSAVLISWESIQDRATEFYICLLALEAGMLGAFVAFDLILFYVFFEG